jgi:hypothetical protein
MMMKAGRDVEHDVRLPRSRSPDIEPTRSGDLDDQGRDVEDGIRDLDDEVRDVEHGVRRSR